MSRFEVTKSKDGAKVTTTSPTMERAEMTHATQNTTCKDNGDEQ
jgi:hypothetical protein